MSLISPLSTHPSPLPYTFNDYFPFFYHDPPQNSITCEVSASKTRSQGRDRSCCGRLLYQVITLYRGWRTYMQYNVALAGLALACLYMTVLGFDNITVGKHPANPNIIPNTFDEHLQHTQYF